MGTTSPSFTTPGSIGTNGKFSRRATTSPAIYATRWDFDCQKCLLVVMGFFFYFLTVLCWRWATGLWFPVLMREWSELVSAREGVSSFLLRPASGKQDLSMEPYRRMRPSSTTFRYSELHCAGLDFVAFDVSPLVIQFWSISRFWRSLWTIPGYRQKTFFAPSTAMETSSFPRTSWPNTWKMKWFEEVSDYYDYPRCEQQGKIIIANNINIIHSLCPQQRDLHWQLTTNIFTSVF